MVIDRQDSRTEDLLSEARRLARNDAAYHSPDIAQVLALVAIAGELKNIRKTLDELRRAFPPII